MSLASQIALLAARIAQEINTRGMPKAGNLNQVLRKTAGTNFSAAWSDAPRSFKFNNSAVQSTSVDITGSDLYDMQLVTVFCIASNFTQMYTLLVWRSPFNSGGSITVLWKSQINNSPGFNDVSFAVTSNRLYASVSNAGATQINMITRVTEIGTNS